ncbi:Transcriptional regulator [Thermoplasmatales archaeon BRNA1]|nr:Transcriptional regulator [Thermoplasmatales archaeon BRNA1]
MCYGDGLYMSDATKQQLADSFKKLLETKAYDDITVSDITEGCNMSRQTFYYHFKSMFDIVKWCYFDEAMRDRTNLLGYGTWLDKLKQVFAYTVTLRNIIISVYNSRSLQILLDYFLEEGKRRIGDIVDLRSDGILNQGDRDFFVNALSFAFVGVMVKWIDDGMMDTPETMVRRLDAVIGAGYIRNSIDKLAKSLDNVNND